jgi:uncharacterized iron-regulated membrane protein
MRVFWRRMHRWCGLVLALFLIVIGLSGSVIAFEHELEAWLNPTLFNTGGDGSALPADQLIARIERFDPRLRVALLPLDAPPGRSIEVQVQPRRKAHARSAGDATVVLGFDRLFVDPATGRVLGQRLWGAWRLDRAHILPLINRLHRSLHLPGRWGNWLLGTVALGWLGLSLMGVYLSLPISGRARTGSRSVHPPIANGFCRRWKPAWQIKRGARGVRLAYELHRAVGLWTLVFAGMLAFSGVYLNLGTELFKPLVSLFSPVTPHPLSTLPKAFGNPVQPVLGAEDAIAHARALLPPEANGFDAWYLSPVPALGVYRVAFKEPGLRERIGRLRYEQVFIDEHSGAKRAVYGYDSGSAGDRFLAWQYPMHSGKVLGWFGRILVCLSGFAIALLCGTGAYLWWRRTASAK